MSDSVMQGFGKRLAYKAAGDPPPLRQITTNFDVASMNNFNSRSVMSEVDFMQGNSAYQSLGSSWGASSSIAAPYLSKEIFG